MDAALDARRWHTSLRSFQGACAIALAAFWTGAPAGPCDDVRSCVSVEPAPLEGLPHDAENWFYSNCGDKFLHWRYCDPDFTLESSTFEGRRSEYLADLQAEVDAQPGCQCGEGGGATAYLDQLTGWAAPGEGRTARCFSFPYSLPMEDSLGGFENYNEAVFAYGVVCSGTGTKGQIGWTAFKRQRGRDCPAGTEWTGDTTPGKHCARTGPDPGKNRGEPLICPFLTAGNPIHVGTGNKFQREVDYLGAGVFPLRFERFYNSDAGVESRRIGAQWRHSYDRTLRDHGANVTLHRADGKALYFWDVGGAWVGDPDVPGRLRRLEGETDAWEYVDAGDVVERYDARGLLETITTRDEFTQTLEYDELDRLVRVRGPFGRAILLAYDHEGRVQTLTDPAGARYRYAYDDEGNLASVSYPDDTPGVAVDNPERIYHYEDPTFAAALTGITAETGERLVTWLYDAQGRAVSSIYAGDVERVDLAFNADGTTTVTDALGAARVYHLETQHGLIRQSRLDGGPCATGCGSRFAQYTYDANGYPQTRTDFNGVVTRFEYDARGLEVSRTEAAGTAAERTISTTWHPTFRLPTRISEPGKTTAFTYDAQGRLLTRTETDTATGRSRTVANTYDAQGLLASRDGPRTDVADVTTFAYDAQGNLTEITDALGHVSRITAHDLHGRPLAVEDPNGLATTLAYDARGRLVSRSVAGAVTAFAYDAAGNITRTTLPDGSFLRSEYDAAQRLVAIEDTLGNRIEYALDAAGNRIGETVRDPGGAITRTRTRVYDTLGRLAREVGGAGQTRDFEYDDNGNETALVVDAAGLNQRTESHHDALARLAKSIDPELGETDLGYDGRDNLVAVTDAEGLTTRYTYDGLDNLLAQSSPDTGLTQFTYDEAGNRLTRTDARGVLTTYTYDALDRLTGIRYPNPAKNVTFTYDEGPNGIGRLTGIVDESGSTRLAYDIRGNLVTEIRTIGGVPYRTDYAYDAANRLTSITYPSGTAVLYARDSLGRVDSVDVQQGASTRSVLSGIDYLPFGPVERFTYGNGIVMTRTFDPDYRLSTQTAGSVQDFTLAYDNADNITRIENGLEPWRSQSFDYDALNRLTYAQGVYGTKGYTYDAIGNRLTLSDAAGLDTYTYAPDSHRLEAITGPGATTFAYDAAGNTIAKNALAFVYDDTNRMREAYAGGTLVGEYLYNARGERVRKDSGGDTTIYHYDVAGSLIAESTPDGITTKEYVYLDGQLIAMLVADTAPPETAAELTAPAPRATLDSDTATFTWTAAPGATQYRLEVGYSEGASEIDAMDLDAGTTAATVGGIPLAGGTIHVRLGTRFGTQWEYRQYTFATAAVVAPAELVDPVPGATLEGDPVTFTWAAAPGATQYRLAVGYSAGAGEIGTLYLDAPSTAATVGGIPLAGGTIHVELGTNFGTHWAYREYTYETAEVALPAELIAPARGTTIDSDPVNFTWTAAPGATQYRLEVGYSAGAGEIDATDFDAATTAATVGAIPLAGGTIHVQLATNFGTHWAYRRYSFETAALVGPAQISDPVLGATIEGDTVTFTWAAVPGAVQYRLTAGTTSGGEDIHPLQVVDGSTSAITVTGIPLEGAPIHVALGTNFGIHWASREHAYETADLLVLHVGVLDTGQYGYNYGSSEHYAELGASFIGAGMDLTLSVTGHDIDDPAGDEVAVYLNDVFLGYLSNGPNNGLNDGDVFSIPVSMQKPGANIIRFKQKVPGWRWGVTDLLLSDASLLTIVTSEVPQATYASAYSATLESGGGSAPYTWSVAGGALPAELVLQSDGEIAGTPSEQGGFAFTARVSDAEGAVAERALALEVVGTSGTVEVVLEVGVMDTGQYGYGFGASAHASGLYATFIGAGEDLVLEVTGYDVDDPAGDEVAVYLNDAFLGYLSNGPNNGLNDGDAFAIPASAQQSGANLIHFKQKVPGWKWGVTDLLLTAGPMPVAIETTSLPEATYATSYAVALKGSGGSEPYSWSIVAGALPEGLVLDGSGELSGTPSEQGSFAFTVQLSDAASAIAERALTLEAVGTSGTVEVVLDIGVTDTGQYGYGFGTSEHASGLYATFLGTGVDLTLHVTGYDIDDPAGDEVAVYLNDVFVGYLSNGPNNGLNAGDTFSIPASAQQPGANLIYFKQKVPGWKWGVTGLLLAP